MHKYITELIGSFFLILALGLTGNALATGLLLIPVFYLGGQVSGAHYNPAVSIAFWAARGLSSRELLGYLFFQLAGVLTGSILLYFLIESAYQLSPPASSSPFQYSAVEVIFALLFCLIYLVLFATRYFKNNRVYGLIIGLTYAGILLTGEPISGGVVNPAAASAASMIDFFDYGESYQYLPVYIFGPVVGGLIAGNLFTFIFQKNQNEKHEEA